jgi:hypothetical protein
MQAPSSLKCSKFVNKDALRTPVSHITPREGPRPVRPQGGLEGACEAHVDAQEASGRATGVCFFKRDRAQNHVRATCSSKVCPRVQDADVGDPITLYHAICEGFARPMKLPVRPQGGHGGASEPHVEAGEASARAAGVCFLQGIARTTRVRGTCSREMCARTSDAEDHDPKTMVRRYQTSRNLRTLVFIE